MKALIQAVSSARDQQVISESCAKKILHCIEEDKANSKPLVRASISPPNRDLTKVALPLSWRVRNGLSSTRKHQIHNTFLLHNKSTLQLFQTGLSVEEFYHLGFTKAQLPKIDTNFLKLPTVRLGELADIFGIHKDDLLVDTDPLTAEFFSVTQNTAIDYRKFGYTSNKLLRLDTDKPVDASILCAFPFGVLDWKQHLQLSFNGLILCNFNRTHLTNPGWSYAAVNGTFSLTKTQRQRLGIELLLQ